MTVKCFFTILVFLSCLLYISCTQPVQNDTPDEKEFASVWQHLKTFSIYQDSIPENPFSSPTPQAIFDSIGDTLKGQPYTGYMDESGAVIRQSDALRKYKVVNKGVSFDSLTDSCCLLTISSFMDDPVNNIYDEFVALQPRLDRFSKIIFDVRSNGGGDLTTTDSMISDILPAGIQYIHTIERVYNSSAKTASTVDSIWQTKRSPKNAFVNKKFAVLIDNYSASASEIFAIALKDGLGAPMFGAQSYGKAIGQIHLSRRGRLGLKITFVHFKRISGPIEDRDYHRKGISPDAVSTQLRNEAIIKNVSDQPLFYAIKTLQPSVEENMIKYPLPKRASSSAPRENGLYKIVDESDL